MAYTIDNEILDIKGKELCTFVNDDVRKKLDELSDLFKNAKWDGRAKKMYIDTYRKTLLPMYTFVDMLEKFGYYMQYVAGKFDEVENISQEEFYAFLKKTESDLNIDFKG